MLETKMRKEERNCKKTGVTGEPKQEMRWLKAASKEIIECMLLKAKERKIFIVGMGRSGFVLVKI